MTKAYLLYNLNDYDDKLAHKRALKAYELVLALNDIATEVGEINRYDPDKEFTLTHFYSILDKHGINLTELIV